MTDIIEKIGSSVIQHGSYNDRIYLMKFSSADKNIIFKRFEELISRYNYSKIFCKIQEKDKDYFLNRNFIEEAAITNFNNNKISFISKFTKSFRKKIDDEAKHLIQDVLNKSFTKKNTASESPKADENFTFKIIPSEDSKLLASLYSAVFKTYPFPIFDYKYIEKTMQENIIYSGIYHNNKIIAASSAEIDQEGKTAEMTDFATLPEYRGNGLAVILLKEMESILFRKKIFNLYTIARSHSYGMNITFAKLKYKYNGTLINNTNIYGKIENMNVWSKNSDNEKSEK